MSGPWRALCFLFALGLALSACAGPSESTAGADEATVEAADARWWRGDWVVDTARLKPDESLSPAARQTARALAATFGDRMRYALGPDRVRRDVAGRSQIWPLAGASVSGQRAVLELVGGDPLVLERGPDGVVLSDGVGSRPVRRP